MIQYKRSFRSLSALTVSVAFVLTLTSCNSSSSDPGSGNASVNTPGNGTRVCATAAARSQIIGSFQGAHLATAKAGNGRAMRKMRGHMLAITQKATDLGKMDDSRNVPLTIALQVNHSDQLDQDLADIYTPGSSNFHKFLKPEDFRKRYAPTHDQVSQVTQYLESQGLTSVKVDENGLLIHANGNASDVANAFQTEIHQYVDSSGKAFYANNYEIQVPEGLAIQAVHGLHNYTVAHNHMMKAVSGAMKGVTGHGGSGPSGAYSPSDIRNAYGLPSGLDGSGQTLAVFELDGYNASNVTTYENQFGLPNVPLQNVLVDGQSGSAGGGEAEVELDIELMAAIAPKAAKIMVYEGPNSDQGMLDTYNKIATDNIAQSISSSWGSSEDGVTSSFMQSENTIFKQMAAQGQTIYSAAGDTGAKDNGSSLSIDDPSGQPYVVAVGGTSLTTGSNGSYSSETTWNDSSGGGGGGISAVWSIPSWQKNVSVASNRGSTSMRMIPDVAMNSDIQTGYSIYTGGSWGTWGGTSAAAPIWAAFNALVNQQRAANGLGPIGFITPTLYSIGASSRYSSDFYDIADNSTNGYYPAVSGYDLATGWGSFKASALLQDLASNAGISAPTSSCISQ